jgi:HD-GYP domain-containing protein (c-di-GMP phosphodiesterase class II)
MKGHRPVPEGPPPILLHDRSFAGKVARGSDASLILDQQVLWLGTQLVNQISILLKTARIHDAGNAALDQSVGALLALLKTVGQDKPVSLRVQNDFLFLGDRHLKMSAQQVAIFMEFIDLLNAWGIGAVTFPPRVTGRELVDLAYLFATMDPTAGSFAALQAELRGRGLSVEIEEASSVSVRLGERNRQAKLLARNSYVKAAAVAGDAPRSLREGRAPALKHGKRVIQTLVDLMMHDPAILLGLSTLRCYDQYSHNHSVNVAILSVALGARAGFPKAALADLGLAALFHDIGKSSAPPELLAKGGELNEAEWRLLRRHPADGVVCLARLRGIRRLPKRMTVAAFEHHMGLDGSGYPNLGRPWKPSVTARIVAIADTYDAMTAGRVYRREPVAPAVALQKMLAMRRFFDPALLKLFVNCIGIYPVGSLLLLDSNELAVVTRPAPDGAPPERPSVRLITDARGNPGEGPEVDLAERLSTGDFRRSVVRLVDNTEYGFDTSRFLV